MRGEVPLPLEMPPQPRRSRAESRQFHRAVMALRRGGFRVYRAGPGMAVINGVRMPDTVIERYARKPGRGRLCWGK